MKLFVLLSRVPYPLEKGDKLRAYNHIKFLSRSNEIILCAINTPNSSQLFQSFKLWKSLKSAERIVQIEALKPFCKRIEIINLTWFDIFLNLLRGIFTERPFQVEYFYNKKGRKRIDNLIIETKPDHIFCQLIRVAEYVKNQNIVKTLDYQDAFSKGIERRMSTSSFFTRWILKIELKRLLKYEHDIFSSFNNKTIISKADRDLIPHPDKDKIIIIPNGVDTGYYNPNSNRNYNRYDLLFTGNMGYHPNIVSALYLAKEILPLIKQSYPEIKLLIAGANPHKKIKELESINIHVSGWVEDIRECYAESDIFIAPMIIGTGLQNKLLEAMAIKLPCITSELANEALRAENGKEIIVCQSTEEYAANVIKLINNKAYKDEIASNGYNFVIKYYNWSFITQKLEDLMMQ